MFNFGGGMLTGKEIERQIKKGNIHISPYDPKQLNPNSYNLKLHPQLLVYKRGANGLVSPTDIITPFNNMHNCKDKADILPSYINGDTNDKASNDSTVYDRIDIPISESGGTINKIESITEDLVNKIDRISQSTILRSTRLEPLDMMKKNETTELVIPETGFILEPGVLYIGRTVERTSSDKFIPMINGRSSGGRLGISIHVCAGFGDIGFDGTWTLEITVVEPVIIYPNVEIAQVCYFKPCGNTDMLYRGRYYRQEDATASRFYKKKENIK